MYSAKLIFFAPVGFGRLMAHFFVLDGVVVGTSDLETTSGFCETVILFITF